ncbi:MAG: polysaccharide pyruvyl transferase family protein [Cyanobacteriota bacterium]|nr:polysaccharide pyruvyl transferase family protein [Cyanobacteriota bacterium]
MNDLSSPTKVKEALHQSLEGLGKIESCALLDYPASPNIGDHLIWLGTIFYLNEVLKAKIKYAATCTDFSEDLMNQKNGQAPILLHGGGNLGDIWLLHQRFREQIISKYQDRKIFIMPQSIYFADKNNLKIAANIFNSHPQLTIFARDNYSYQIAIDNFNNCQIIKAPDMFFQMINSPGLPIKTKRQSSILYFCRQDKELNKSFSPDSLGISNLVVEDWVSFNWMVKAPEDWAIYIPGMVRLIREGWQRGLATPGEWLSRQKWDYLHPYSDKFNTMDRPELHRRSWSMMHAGMHQMLQHRLVITNRLHGHILCLLLKIPHVFLPNSYYKNELFYQTWTQQIPFCRFVKESGEVKSAVEELLELYPSGSTSVS